LSRVEKAREVRLQIDNLFANNTACPSAVVTSGVCKYGI